MDDGVVEDVEEKGEKKTHPPKSDEEVAREMYHKLDVDMSSQADWRLNALHFNGVSKMSTSMVRDYLAPYEPFQIDWVHDNGCNVVFNNCQEAMQCLLGVIEEKKSNCVPESKERHLTCKSFGSNEGLLVRFARSDDAKKSKSYVTSNYYRKYGNPHFGGIHGYLSRKMRTQLAAKPHLAKYIERRFH